MNGIIYIDRKEQSEKEKYLTHSAGGEDQVGHTMKDHMNFVNRDIEDGDAKTFMGLIQKTRG
ncbi:hypothetical protein ACS0TY_007102 [Phlomoides rotata]